MTELREYHRFLLHTKITHQSVKTRKSAEAASKDISVAGICFTTADEPLTINETYSVMFSLPNDPTEIEAQAIVKWNRAYTGYYDNGLLFTKISDDHREFIKEFSIGSVGAE